METVRASDYHDIVQVGEPRISPDSERVAYVRTVPDGDEEYEATVYVVPIGGGEPRRFTVAEGVDAEPRWSPSGDRLAFVSTRGADDDRPRLWVLPTDGGEARRVTDVVGGVSEIAWSPDGSRIVFVQRVSEDDREADRDIGLGDEEYEPDPPDPRVIDRMIYRAGEQYFDGRRTHVYVADLEADSEARGASEDVSSAEQSSADHSSGLRGGEAASNGTARPSPGPREGGGTPRAAVERVTDGDYDHTTPAWGDESTLYYGVRRTGDPDDNIDLDIVAYDLDAGEETETVVETTGWGAMLAATSDGRVAYAYTPAENATLRQNELEVVDRETGDVTRPTEDLDRTLSMDVSIQWGPEESELYFSTPDEGDVAIWRAPGDASADPERVVAEGHVSGASVGEDAVAFVRSEWDHPGDVFATTRGGAETRRLTRVNADYLDDRAIAQPEEIRFENEAGDGIQGWVLTPPDFDSAAWDAAGQSSGDEPRDPDERYPLAVEIHGGPHTMWSTSGTMWQEFQLLAARGYVVFWSNPRGSTGYGEAFMTAVGEGGWGPVAAEDILAGVDGVADREYVDEDDTFVTGGSYGGYMTTWLVGHTDRFSGAVSQRGVYELNSFYGSTDAFKLVEWDFDTTPWDDAEFLWEHSPAAYADRVDTPTLLVHSDDDYRVPVNNAEMLYLMYKKNDVETRLVRYPREGHELSRSGEPGHVVDRLERIVRWFDGYSGHSDVPKALERGDEGLSAAESEDGEADEGDETAE